MVICADGLAGIKEAISAAYPKAEYQRCIVHMVRNTLKYVNYKDMKSFASDLKTIFHASYEEMVSSDKKLGKGIWRILHNVPRQNAGNKLTYI